jgi:hypothetical protein
LLLVLLLVAPNFICRRKQREQICARRQSAAGTFQHLANRLPVVSLTLEGWIELKLLSEDDLTAISI